MAIAVLFEASQTWEQYEASLTKLEEAGWGRPKGRLYHVVGPTDIGIRGVDVWDSPEAYEEFGNVLVPILQELGAAPPDLRIWPAQRIIQP